MNRRRFVLFGLTFPMLLGLGACALSESSTGPSATGSDAAGASPGGFGVANHDGIANGTTFKLGGRSATANVTNHPTTGEVEVTVTDANGTSNASTGPPGPGHTASDPTVGGDTSPDMSTGTGSQTGGDTYRVKKVGSDVQLQRKNANGDWIDMGAPRKIRPVST